MVAVNVIGNLLDDKTDGLQNVSIKIMHEISYHGSVITGVE